MRIAPRTFFAISALAFIVASGFSFWRLSPAENTGIMSCSTKGIMRFENMEKENVNGNIHFNFGSQGKGSMVVEGYTDSAAGWLYLQRYVKFTYTSKRVSRRGKIFSGVQSTLIILSTMFIKQHSTFDVATAFALGLIVYVIVYRSELVVGILHRHDAEEEERAVN